MRPVQSPRGGTAARDRRSICLRGARAGRPAWCCLRTRCPCSAPVVTALPEADAATKPSGGAIEIAIEIAGFVVRAEPGVNLNWLRDVLRAVKAAHMDCGSGGDAGAGGHQAGRLSQRCGWPCCPGARTTRQQRSRGRCHLPVEKRADRLEILAWDGSGLVLFWKLSKWGLPLAADQRRRDATERIAARCPCGRDGLVASVCP